LICGLGVLGYSLLLRFFYFNIQERQGGEVEVETKSSPAQSIYIRHWNNPIPNPDEPVGSVKIEVALRPEVSIVLGITGMRARRDP